MRRPTQSDSSYNSFEYRWNYEEYQKSLQKQHRRASGSGMQAFFLTTAFVFLICFTSLVMVLGAAFMRGDSEAAAVNGVPETDHETQSTPLTNERTEESENKTLPEQVTTQIVAFEASPVVVEYDEDQQDAGVLGILGENVTTADAKRVRLPVGVRIMTVLANETAARAGLRRDDILLSIENTPIQTLAALAAWEQTLTQPKSVSVRIYREGKELSFEIVVNRNGEIQYPN